MGKVIPIKKPKQLPLSDGCGYVVATGHKGKTPFKVFCNKMVQSGSQHCPKHILIVEDEGKESGRRKEARRAKREHEQAEATALALSPLRAYNPIFDDVIENTGYQPAERKR